MSGNMWVRLVGGFLGIMNERGGFCGWFSEMVVEVMHGIMGYVIASDDWS